MTIHQAKDLKAEKDSSKEYSPFIEVFLIPNQPSDTSISAPPSPSTLQVQQHDGALKGPVPQHYYKTKTKKKNNSPLYEEPFEMFIQDVSNQCLLVVVKDQRDALVGGPIVIGECVIPVREIIKDLVIKNEND